MLVPSIQALFREGPRHQCGGLNSVPEDMRKVKSLQLESVPIAGKAEVRPRKRSDQDLFPSPYSSDSSSIRNFRISSPRWLGSVSSGSRSTLNARR